MKLMLMIDGDNLLFAQKYLGWWIDPGKLRSYVSKMGDLVDSNYYVSLHDEISEEKDRFLKALTHLQFRVVGSPVKCIRLPDGTVKNKTSLDIKIAVDSVITSDQYDELVLVSGDGDFTYLIETLLAKGKRFYVLSIDQMIAKELKELAGAHYINLLDLKKEIEKERPEEV